MPLKVSTRNMSTQPGRSVFCQLTGAATGADAEATVCCLGHVYRKQRRWKQAVAMFEKALGLAPWQAGTFAALGFIYHLQVVPCSSVAGQHCVQLMHSNRCQRNVTHSSAHIVNVRPCCCVQRLALWGSHHLIRDVAWPPLLKSTLCRNRCRLSTQMVIATIK